MDKNEHALDGSVPGMSDALALAKQVVLLYNPGEAGNVLCDLTTA